jgi:hypothetical protein
LDKLISPFTSLDTVSTMKKIYIILIFLISLTASAQVNYHFSGYIRDTLDGKPLPKASINIDFGKFGGVTDDKGFG